MFDWLKNLLFEEEEVVVEESEIEELDFSNNRRDIADIIVQPSMQEERAEKEMTAETIEPAVKSGSFGIEVEPVQEVREQEKKPTRVFSAPVREAAEPKNVEMNVISPMYGGTFENKPNKKVVIDTVPKRRSDALGTVISPMYGQSELATHEQEAMQRIEEVKPAVVVGDDWEEDDVTLEDILFNEEESEDCVQFSLFGDEVESVKIEEENLEA